MADTPLAYLSLTTVHYDPTSTVSYLCAWLALTPQVLCIIYATLIFITREAEIILMFTGQMCCEALNWALKRYIKEARPKEILHLHKGYGMPSSHAQFISFFSVSVSLFLLLRHTPVALKAVPAHIHHLRIAHAILSSFVIMGAVVVSISRVYLSYHTPKQVLFGCIFGTTFAILWFCLTGVARRTGLVQRALDLKIVRLMRLRDLICEEDLVDIGWREWEARQGERRAAGRSLTNGHSKKAI